MKFHILKSSIAVGLILSMFSCNYENDTHYSIEVGEKVDVYYSVNSCCHTCILNKDKLGSIELTGRKVITKQQRNVDGGSSVSAYKVVGKTKGLDTLIVNRTSGGENCDSVVGELSHYYFEVK